MNPYFYPAKLLRYHADKRVANIHIDGLTDGIDEGIEANLAYPIGDDDMDTERLLEAGADVWVFFEQGDVYAPVIAFYRSHGTGAVVDTRRIRQANIELLAGRQMTLSATDGITAATKVMTIDADVVINGNLTHNGDSTITGNVNHSGNLTQTGSSTITGNLSSQGTVAASKVTIGGKDMATHRHSGVETGRGTSGPPV